MENKKNFSIFIRIILLFLNINKYISSYLPIGLTQLNYFIYLDRFKVFSFQKYNQKCSLNNGPNCYYIENKRIIKYEEENNQLKDIEQKSNEILDYKKEWKDIYTKSKELGYINSFNEINTYISDYKKYISSKNDSEQIPSPINLRLRLTFESYDDITIKGDIYAYPSKSVKFNTEYVYIEIFGKLRLHYGEDLKLKNQMRYPSKTFGIIESQNLTIRLGKKLFVCEYFFLRIRDENIYKINIEKYLENENIFIVQKDMNYNKKNWIKITLPNKEIDSIIIPGGVDVDNFSFVMTTKKQYDIAVQFHANTKQRIKNLVEDSDIF